jgi:class 3 adenylate cyclase/HEAT repeat protein
MAHNPITRKTESVLGRDGKITVLTLLKNFYDEEIFTLLVKEIYNSDIAVSEAAISASGSLGNEVAIPHLYQIIERGRKPQRVTAIKALMAIRAPSSTAMLIKYFNHFPEEELRTEILRAINVISPNSQQVQELNHAVYTDAKQSEAVKRIAVEALVEAERYPFLKDTLPRAVPAVQQAAFVKMLQTGSQEVPDISADSLSSSALGCYLCVYTLKAKNPPSNYVLEMLQKGESQTILSFLLSLQQFQGRLRFPARVFRLLLMVPFVDTEMEALVGDFLKKIVVEVKGASPHLLSEFSVTAAAHLDTVFSKVKKNFISLQGISAKDVLLATVLATLLERHANPSLLAEVQAFFKDEGYAGRSAPVAQVRAALAAAPKEELNRFEACVPLFMLTEKKDKLMVFSQVSKVDLNRPFNMRRLNRLIRTAGYLEIRSTAKRIQDILEFARRERIQFLEETSIVTLCQLLTRSIIELSREYFKDPTRNVRSLNGYIRGARFIPPKIMIGPLVQIVHHAGVNPQSRALAVESLEVMGDKITADRGDLSVLKRMLPPLLKTLDMKEVSDALKLRIGDLLAKYGDSTIGHQALDLTSQKTPVLRRVAVRVLKALVVRGEGAPTDIVTNRLYLLLEDPDKSVRVEALLALLSMTDDYASQILSDYVHSGDAGIVADILKGLTKPVSRETFTLMLEMLHLDSLPVQEALRALLPELSQGTYAEELRQGLLGALTVGPTQGAGAAPTPSAAETVLEPGESTIDSAKLEFKFRRENTQVLTVFFIDIFNSTEKSTNVDMSAFLKLIKAFEEITSTSITENRGTIIKKMGDGVLATFKTALNGTIASLAIQRKIKEYSAMRVEQEKFQARIGLHTGSVIRKDNDIFGETVNIASRMQSSAPPGDIYLTEDTYTEIKDYVRCTKLGPITVKGIKDPISSYSPEEVTINLEKFRSAGGAAAVQGALRDSALEKLKESIFVPTFQVPSGKGGAEDLAKLLRDIFSTISKGVEELASDNHEEYMFKKYLQDRWNDLMEKM